MKRLACLAAFLLLVSNVGADASIITFSGLTGANNDPFTNYSEAGFSVAVTSGVFTQGQTVGAYRPEIVARTTSTILVTQSNLGTFTFAGFDFSPFNAVGNTAGYSYQGYLGGNLVFSDSADGVYAPLFVTIASNSPTTVIDRLFITARIGTNISTALDNINVSAASVPEPSSVALCGVAGLIGLGVARARRRAA